MLSGLNETTLMAVAATVAGAAGPGTPVTLDSLFAEYIADQESTKMIARVAEAAFIFRMSELQYIVLCLINLLPCGFHTLLCLILYIVHEPITLKMFINTLKQNER